jgi:hypothetical protein
MVEEASEFFKEIRLAVTERLTSPLVGTYWISWLIWNFKFILIIFSGEPVITKFQLIHDDLFWGPQGYIWTYGGPAAMTIAFIFFYPYPAEVVYKFRLQFQRRLTRVKQKIEDETLLSVEDGRKLRLEIREKEQNFVSRLAEAEQEIDDLRKVNESLGKQRDNHERKVDGGPDVIDSMLERAGVSQDSIGGLTPIETAVMKTISGSSRQVANETTIIMAIQKNAPQAYRAKLRLETQDALAVLSRERFFLTYGGALDGDKNYSFTEAGKKFALEHNL